MTTSEWFKSLTQRERKNIVCMLFELLKQMEDHRHFVLFDALLRTLDDEYHSLKVCRRPESSVDMFLQRLFK